MEQNNIPKLDGTNLAAFTNEAVIVLEAKYGGAAACIGDIDFKRPTMEDILPETGREVTTATKYINKVLAEKVSAFHSAEPKLFAELLLLMTGDFKNRVTNNRGYNLATNPLPVVNHGITPACDVLKLMEIMRAECRDGTMNQAAAYMLMDKRFHSTAMKVGTPMATHITQMRTNSLTHSWCPLLYGYQEFIHRVPV